MFQIFKKKIKNNAYLKDKIEKVKEKGHQRMTILIIPHGFESSFNFQISIFTISFFLILILSLIGLAIFGIARSQNIKSQLQNLSKVYGSYFVEYMAMTGNLDKMNEDFSSINEDLSELYFALDGTEEELLKIPSESESVNQAYLEIRNDELNDKGLVAGRSYLSEIYEFRKLKKNLERSKSLLESTSGFLELRSDVMNNLPLIKPMSAYNLTSSFGTRRSPTMGHWENHDGVDLANVTGTPIYATAPGRVYRASYSSTGYGNHIILSHEYGYFTLYGHCSRILVNNGQYVNRGAMIGLVGATGNVTGPHLHYEVWSGESNKLNPDEFMSSEELH